MMGVPILYLGINLAVFVFVLWMLWRAVKALETTAQYQRTIAERLTEIVRHLRQ